MCKLKTKNILTACWLIGVVRRAVAGPLHKHSLGHWNNTVEGLAQNVLKMYMEFDIHLYDRSVKSGLHAFYTADGPVSAVFLASSVAIK